MTEDEVNKYCESIISDRRSMNCRTNRFGMGINDLPHIIKFRDSHGKTRMHSGYNQWATMLTRAYSKKYQDRQKTYIGTTVCDEWLIASNFINWQKTKQRKEGWQLDKDLLFVGNKVYSPDRCIYVPRWLNSFITDSKANRGEYLIGVSYDRKNKRYFARCSSLIEGRRIHLGYFKNEFDAHNSWKMYKLSVAESLKQEMDCIDKRIFDNINEIINNME